MEAAWIGAIGLAIGGLITVAVGAWINLRKSKSETDKADAETHKGVRNGVIEEWREVVDRLKDALTVAIKEAREAREVDRERIKNLEAEVKALRSEISSQLGELSALRTQITARETERVEQRTDIRALEKKVIDLAPDTEAIAAAIAPKIAEALGAKVDDGTATKPAVEGSISAKDSIAGGASTIKEKAQEIKDKADAL